MGENFLKYDVIEGRSNDLVSFIKRIMLNKNKLLIMTTREYILKQAKDKYAKLDTAEIDINKYILDLSVYTKKIRAIILFNHLFYSDLRIEYISDIISKKTYKKIINHKNYSPRIIEQMTIKHNNLPPEKYSEIFLENLNNPLGIWNRAFQSEISEGSKYTLFLLLSIGQPILKSEFYHAMNHFNVVCTQKYKIDFCPLNLDTYLKELEDCFVTINLSDQNTSYIDFQNPSIKDFLIKLVEKNELYLKVVFEAVFYFNQFIYLLNLSKKYYSNSEIKKTINLVILEKLDELKNSSYILSGQVFDFFNEVRDIDKLYEIVRFVKNSDDPKIRNLIAEKFESIKMQNLSSQDENKYLTVFKLIENFTKIQKEDVINNTFKNIKDFNNVTNFIRLKDSMGGVFNKFIKNKEKEIINIIHSVIINDIQSSTGISNLEELENNLVNEENRLSQIFKFDISYYISKIQSEIELLYNDENCNIHKISNDQINSDAVTFNEDELFKIELFDRKI